MNTNVKVFCEACAGMGTVGFWMSKCSVCNGNRWVQKSFGPPEGFAILPKRLTAENGGKGLMIGEFFTKVRETCSACEGKGEQDEGFECEPCGGEGWVVGRAEVDWTTIKDIWARAADFFSARGSS